MKKWILTSILASILTFSILTIGGVTSSFPQLEFIELKQFTHGEGHKKFDLSGLVMDAQGNVYTISDREKHSYIYKLNWDKGQLKKELPFGIKENLDIEAIDICDDSFYVTNEKTDSVFIIKKGESPKKIKIDTKSVGIKKYFFSGNKGFEGLAIDCKNQIMYLTKEREPRTILTVDIKENKILKKWDIPMPEGSFDYSDAKFENGFLYVLERTPMLVTKIDLKTDQVVKKYSYQKMEKKPGYLYGPAMHTFGEALLLTPDEIWIGFDNNGLKATNNSHKELGLTGRAPLVMRFKRPKDF
jgi:uncharacterized protein YjiK